MKKDSEIREKKLKSWKNNASECKHWPIEIKLFLLPADEWTLSFSSERRMLQKV